MKRNGNYTVANDTGQGTIQKVDKRTKTERQQEKKKKKKKV